MEPDRFDKSLKLTWKIFNLSGISVNANDSGKKNILMIFMFYFNLIVLHSVALVEILWIIESFYVGRGFSDFSYNVPCLGICYLATLKCISMFYSKNILQKIIVKLRAIHPSTDNGDATHIFDDKFDIDSNLEDGKIIEMNKGQVDVFNAEDVKRREKAKRAELELLEAASNSLKATIRFFFCCCLGVITIFLLMPAFSMTYNLVQTGHTDLMYPVQAYYFIDINVIRRFPFIYLHHMTAPTIVVTYLFSIDTFMYAFCTFMQMHFRILSHHLSNVVSSSPEETRKRLVKLIRRHQKLIQLVDDMEILYSKPSLYNMVSSSVLICFCGFNVMILEDTALSIAFTAFFVLNASQICLLCYFGDMLSSSSMEVSEAVYACRWYDTDKKNKRIMLIVLARAQKPCKLTAAKFADLNLATCSIILSRSWSYFALLKTVFN